MGERKVYPNPAKDFVTFENTEPETDVTLTITDLFGRKVYEGNINRSAKTVWDTRNVAAGVYVYQLTYDGRQAYTNRLVITR